MLRNQRHINILEEGEISDMNLERLKTGKSGKTKISSRKNLFKKVTAVSISVVVFILAYMVISKANTAAKDTIAVLQVKAEQGIPEKAALSKENVGRYDIIKKEFTSDMVLAEDIDIVTDTFATHYLRKGSILHKDEFIEAQPLKNEWLYNMVEQEEVVTIPYNYLESGGDILTPGDNIRVRVMYEEEVLVGDEENPDNEYGSYNNRNDGKKKVRRTEILFNCIKVEDMLNSSSHSIYEVYKEVLRLPENQRQKVLKSPDFIKSIVPKSLVLSADASQIESYIKYKTASGSKSLLVTILPRQGNTIILDQLPTLQKEIEMWLERQ